MRDRRRAVLREPVPRALAPKRCSPHAFWPGHPEPDLDAKECGSICRGQMASLPPPLSGAGVDYFHSLMNEGLVQKPPSSWVRSYVHFSLGGREPHTFVPRTLPGLSAWFQLNDRLPRFSSISLAFFVFSIVRSWLLQNSSCPL